MKHRLLKVAVVASLAGLALAGCGNAPGSVGSGDTLTIGVLVPRTGGVSETAVKMERSAELAAEQINKSGGVAGKDIVIKVYDDKNTPEEAAKAAQRAITVDHAVALAGSPTSGTALAVREVAERSKVPFLAPGVAAEEFSRDTTYAFRLTPTATDLGRVPAGIAKSLGLKRVSIVYDNGAVGQALKDSFATAVDAYGLQLAGEPVQYEINSTNMDSAFANVKKQNPHAVIIGGSVGADSGLFAKTMAQQGLDVPLLGISNLAQPDSFSVAGAAYDELPGVYYNNNLDQTKPEYQSFIKAYQAEHSGEEVVEQAAQIYDCISVIAKALEATSGEGGRDLAVAVENLKPFEGVSGRKGFPIDFGADHNAFSGSYLPIYQAKDGDSVQTEIELPDIN